MMKLGLIVNPIAGIGGAVGLKGSDGAEIQARALGLGATALAGVRAEAALAPLQSAKQGIQLFTAPRAMGEDAAIRGGFLPAVLSTTIAEPTTAEDTCRAAQAMRAEGVDLILFAGGDGTARDMVRAVGMDLPVLGIPAGVKIHSAVFAVNPPNAGELALGFLHGSVGTKDAEVVDLDEQAYREGRIAPWLYGFLRVPYQPSRVQERKAPTPQSEASQSASIAAAVIESMQPGWLYILGPGTTTRAIAEQMGFQKTLVGVDVVSVNGSLLLDASEQQILGLLAQREEPRLKILVTPVGGQGFLFGRGNQQISPTVIQCAGRENILVISLPGKLAALGGRPLRVDTGDPSVDQMLSGYYRVITGYRDQAIYPVEG